MKCILLTCLLSFAILYSNAQIVEFDLDNPGPRVGDDINITYSIKWENPELPEVLTIDHLDLIKQNQKNFVASGKLKVNNHLTEPGTMSIGPLVFNINGDVFETDSISVQVYPKLQEVNNGLWTRFIFSRGQYYLITEQRVPGKWTREQTAPNSFTSTFSSFDYDGYAKIDEELTNTETFEIKFSSSSINTQTIEPGDGEDSETVHYKLTIYKVTLKVGYQEDYVLLKRNFNHFPEGVTFDPLPIKADN